MKILIKSVVNQEFDSHEVIVASFKFWTITLLLKRYRFNLHVCAHRTVEKV